LNGYNIEKKGNLNGITIFDKVIQYINRSGKKAYYGYNMTAKANERVDVFNGEMGKVRVHNFDLDKFKWNNFRIRPGKFRYNRKCKSLDRHRLLRVLNVSETNIHHLSMLCRWNGNILEQSDRVPDDSIMQVRCSQIPDKFWEVFFYQG